MTTAKTFTDAEQKKIKQLVDEGISVLSEVDTLQGGLKDTIKAIAEELSVKPAVLSRAIKVAFKNNAQDLADDQSVVEDILVAAGRL